MQGLLHQIHSYCGGTPQDQKQASYSSDAQFLAERHGCTKPQPLHPGTGGQTFQCGDKAYKFMNNSIQNACPRHVTEYYVPHYLEQTYGDQAYVVPTYSLERGFIGGQDEVDPNVHETDVLQTGFLPQGDYIDWLGHLRAPIPPEIFIDNYKRMVSVLAHLQDHDFVHGDIKPDNIFMHSDQMYLGDFGLTCVAKETDAKTTRESQTQPESYEAAVMCHKLEGTAGYMPPYMAGIGHATFESDMYALALTMMYGVIGDIRLAPFVAEMMRRRQVILSSGVWQVYGENNVQLLDYGRRAMGLLPGHLQRQLAYLIAESAVSSQPYDRNFAASPHEILQNLQQLDSKPIEANEVRLPYLRYVMALLLSDRALFSGELQLGRQGTPIKQSFMIRGTASKRAMDSPIKIVPSKRWRGMNNQTIRHSQTAPF